MPGSRGRLSSFLRVFGVCAALSRLPEAEARELVLPARRDALARAQEFIEGELRRMGFSDKAINLVSIAAEEIFVNVADYAYGDEGGDVVVGVGNENGEAVLLFNDCGKAFNPLENDDPDITAALDERPVGGLGVFMAKQIMDSLEYFREDGHNILIARKRGNA